MDGRLKVIALIFLTIASTSGLSFGAPDLEGIRITLEIDEANELELNSWDLLAIQKAYQTALADFQKHQTSQPHRGMDFYRVKEGLGDQLQIVKWEIEGDSPADPHGLNNVASHLNENFQEAEILQATNRDLSLVEFRNCEDLWSLLEYTHPTWEKDMVWQKIQACGQKVLYLKPPNSRYSDPKLGTPLSV